MKQIPPVIEFVICVKEYTVFGSIIPVLELTLNACYVNTINESVFTVLSMKIHQKLMLYLICSVMNEITFN